MKKKYCRTLFIPVLALLLGSIHTAQAQDPWAGTPQEAFRNSQIVRTYQCVTCHTIAGNGGAVGPNLNLVGLRRSREWLRRWLDDPQKVKPGTRMPKFDFSPRQLEQTIHYLSDLKKTLHTEEILARDLPRLEKGELLFADYDCYACHRIGNEGRFVGPDLTWLGRRKTGAWERLWLHDPPAFKPDTFMPNLHIPDGAVEALAAFVVSQQGQSNADSQMWEFNVNFFLDNNARERGELIFKRFACWSCHGDKGRGGIGNPNMAPGETMPGLRKVAGKYTEAQLLARLKEKKAPEALDSSKAPPPFFCPDYGKYMDADEFGDLYAYLQSLAPRKVKFRFKRK